MRYSYETLKDFGVRVMVSAGLEPEEAALFMENLLYADSRGVGSHGISRLGQTIEVEISLHKMLL